MAVHRWSFRVSDPCNSQAPDAGAALAAEDRAFAALAHASRRQILLVLHFRGGRMSAGAIAERFGCSWPTTSRHLAVLLDAGLVAAEKHGRERTYVLQRKRLQAVLGDWLGWF